MRLFSFTLLSLLLISPAFSTIVPLDHNFFVPGFVYGYQGDYPNKVSHTKVSLTIHKFVVELQFDWTFSNDAPFSKRMAAKLHFPQNTVVTNFYWHQNQTRIQGSRVLPHQSLAAFTRNAHKERPAASLEFPRNSRMAKLQVFPVSAAESQTVSLRCFVPLISSDDSFVFGLPLVNRHTRTDIEINAIDLKEKPHFINNPFFQLNDTFENSNWHWEGTIDGQPAKENLLLKWSPNSPTDPLVFFDHQDQYLVKSYKVESAQVSKTIKQGLQLRPVGSPAQLKEWHVVQHHWLPNTFPMHTGSLAYPRKELHTGILLFAKMDPSLEQATLSWPGLANPMTITSNQPPTQLDLAKMHRSSHFATETSKAWQKHPTSFVAFSDLEDYAEQHILPPKNHPLSGESFAEISQQIREWQHRTTQKISRFRGELGKLNLDLRYKEHPIYESQIMIRSKTVPWEYHRQLQGNPIYIHCPEGVVDILIINESFKSQYIDQVRVEKGVTTFKKVQLDVLPSSYP